ncbi:ABC_transporter family protein [Hexamita inflata]|uniref:ABC_transporter family protein n=1 Tax=Hexamita inflata TaxID=28002 RepID=A0ABP1H341_9EUKA
MSYELLMITQHLLLNIPIFVYGVSISVFQIIIIVVIVNWGAVKMIIRKKLCIHKNTEKYSNDIINCEQYVAETLDVENTGSSMLIVQNVHHIYDTGTYALKGINLNILKGQIFGLLGSNGSGKSTLMHCMAGIYKPIGGKALMDTSDGVIDLFKFQQVSKYFSIIPQHDIYWPNLSVIDHLQLMQKLNSLQRPVRIDLLLNALQLDEVKDQPADSLSGGVKRRQHRNGHDDCATGAGLRRTKLRPGRHHEALRPPGHLASAQQRDDIDAHHPRHGRSRGTR